MRLTPFGKQVRKLRIDGNLKLADMATYLRVTPSYLSSIETGRKPVNEEIVRGTIEFFRQHGIEALELRALADQSQKVVSVCHLLERERETVVALARRFPQSKDESARKLFLSRVEQFMKEEC